MRKCVSRAVHATSLSCSAIIRCRELTRVVSGDDRNALEHSTESTKNHQSILFMRFRHKDTSLADI